MSVRLLAVDTTSESGSIALSDDDRVTEEVAIHSPDGFGHILFDQVLTLLARHGIGLQDLDGFAAAAGPGSFTGVRIGLTAVKGLAEANGKQVVAVSNLEALASFGSRPLRAPVLDARRGEIYGAVYDEALNVIQPEVVMPLDAWLAALPEGEWKSFRGGSRSRALLIRWCKPTSIGGAIAGIASRRFALALGQDPVLIDANYVRRSDAELLWRDPLATSFRQTS